VPFRFRLLFVFLFATVSLAFPARSFGATPAPAHDQFKVAVYITVGVVEKMKDPAWLEQSWEQLNSQVHVDKVYIETYRSGLIADDALLDTVKAFFVAHGVEVAGGIAYAAGGDNVGREGPLHQVSEAEPGQFVSFSYTDPAHRAYVKHIAEVTARHFDEIMLDDFFFNNTKWDSDIAAKGDQTWSAFRLKLMDEVSRNLVVGPATAVNPKVKVIIKFPNWYEHFQANGYDLDQEPKIFPAIYTGTETRDPVDNDQHLQQYESYEIVRYFDNIAPGRNGGGWVDTYGTRYLDRYAEQLWDTMLAKTPQILLFQYGDLLRPAQMGNRKAWEGLDTTFKAAELAQWSKRGGATGAPSNAAAAGYALSKVNAVTGKLGKPMGIASYKPYQSTGEDFLQNYLGMIGIPVEMTPAFPVDAKTVLLTEQAKFDKEIVAKIKAHLEKGGTVIVTSGLLKAIQDKGFEKIAEITNTGNVLNIQKYWGGSGAGAGADLGNTKEILVPEIGFMTNDAWPVVRGTANGRGAPLLVQDHFSRGTLYVLTIPENANDLYSLPQTVLTSMRQYLLRGFPVQIDAPSQVSLFAYDNHSLVVESFLDAPAKVKVTALGSFTKLRNAATGEVVEATPEAAASLPPWMRPLPIGPHSQFVIEVAPHSFAAFVEE
jgi:hypothetical protein